MGPDSETRTPIEPRDETVRGKDERGAGSVAGTLGYITSALLLLVVVRSVAGILHPFVAVTALFVASHPFRHQTWVAHLRRSALFLVAIWLLYQLKDMLTPFVVALALAYVLDPVVDGLCGNWKPMAKLHMRRWVASLIVVGLLVLVALSIGAQVGNTVIGQADELSQLVQTAGEKLQSLLESSSMQDNVLTQRILSGLVDAVAEITTRIPELARTIASKIGVAIAGFFGALLTIVLLFYALKDFDLLIGLVREKYLPESFLRVVDPRISRVDATLKAFIGGYIVTSLFVGVATLAILLAFGYREVALLLALITALLNIIPVIGFWVSAAIIFVVGLAKGMGLMTLGVLVLSLAALNVIEGNILQPRIIGRRVGLHPLLFILGIAVFAKLLGITGALLGVPLAAIISQEWQSYLERCRSRNRET
ncbi:AI-2E family transporter [Candidatus Fermentibacterales bacterium]|nr:AI-2E family transporter [Candidatus Fermentibacterales bacterium]